MYYKCCGIKFIEKRDFDFHVRHHEDEIKPSPDYKRLLEIAVEALERIESGPEIPISSIGPRTPKEIAIWAAENSQEIARDALEKIREMK